MRFYALNVLSALLWGPAHVPMGVLAIVAFMAARRTMLGRVDSVGLLFGYPLFIALCFAR